MSGRPRIPLWRRHLRFWRDDVGAEVNDELAFHVEQRIEDLVAGGLTPDAARVEALRRIGDLEMLKQSCVTLGELIVRKRNRGDWFDSVRTDVRTAVRQIVRSPLVSVASIVTLALGVGANTAMFSMVYAVLLRPLPYHDANRVAAITETQRGSPTGVGPGQFTEWLARNRTFESLAAMNTGSFTLSDEGSSERVIAAFATPSFFRVNFIPAVAGRYFLPDEAVPGQSDVVVLGHGLFTQRFGSDARVIGRTIRLNERPYRVVGVAPVGYRLRADDPQLWVPLALTTSDQSKFEDHWLTVVGKLKPGVTLQTAQRDMERVTRQIAALHPHAMVDRSARVSDLRGDLTADFKTQIILLFAAVGTVLLLACLNVAALFITRLHGRRREIAVRAALGAGRARLVRQLLTESVVLSVIGGVLSSGVAYSSMRVMLHIAPGDVPRLDETGGGIVVALFAVGLTVLTALVLGVMPALRATKGDLQSALRDGGRSSNTASSRDPIRSWLVVGEFALALMLLAGAMLFVRSAQHLNRVDPGFDPQGLTSTHVSLASPRYADPARLTAAADRILERIRSLPNVRAATATTSLPLADGGPDVELHVDGRSFPDGQEPYAYIRLVAPNYFAAMGIPVLRGRPFGLQDRAGAPPSVIVSDELARQLWPGTDPIGKRLYCCGDAEAHRWREVVGVAQGVHQWLAQAPRAEIYVPYGQAPPASWSWSGNTITLAIRADTQAVTFKQIKEAVGSVDPTIPLYDLRTVDDLRHRSTSGTRFVLTLLSMFAVLAVCLAAIGIYGVLAFLVGQRSQEIALRMALGADRARVFAMIFREGGTLALGGVAVGLGLAILCSRSLTHLLYGITPNDPISYVSVAGGLIIVALVACYVPARRAAGVDPAAVLRE